MLSLSGAANIDLQLFFRGLLSAHSRYGLHARRVAMRPSTPKAPTASLPLLSLRLLPGGANQFPGESYTTEVQRLSRRTVTPIIHGVQAGPSLPASLPGKPEPIPVSFPYLLSSTTRSYNGCVGRASCRYSFENCSISAAETVTGCLSTNHVTFSLQGGVVRDPGKV